MARSGADPIYWDDAYPIALALKANYPDVEPMEIDHETLRRWVIALPGFNDDPAMGRIEWLDDIRREWLEIGGVNWFAARALRAAACENTETEDG